MLLKLSDRRAPCTAAGASASIGAFAGMIGCMTDRSGIQRAVEAVRQRLDVIPAPAEDEWIIVEEDIIEFALGWVIPWTSRLFHEAGSFEHAVVGNGPMLVNGQTFDLVVLDTGLGSEEYIARYLEWHALPAEARIHWSPLMAPDELIVLIDKFARGADTSGRLAARIVNWIDENGRDDDGLTMLRTALAHFKAGRKSTSTDSARFACQTTLANLRPRLTLPACSRCGAQLDDHRMVMFRSEGHGVCRREATCVGCEADFIGVEVAEGRIVWTMARG
jgi:hypothetical protein